MTERWSMDSYTFLIIVFVATLAVLLTLALLK